MSSAVGSKLDPESQLVTVPINTIKLKNVSSSERIEPLDKAFAPELARICALRLM